MGKDTKTTILNQNRSQRDSFFKQIYEMMKHDKDIVIVVADMSTPIFDKVREDFPHRFFNTGIAEQNAILVASGLAREGKKVFVYAISTFMVMRCYEQIRVSQGVMKLPITIVGVGSGYSYDDSGPTHHMLEDISIMRVLPHMTIHSISDNVMARRVAEQSPMLLFITEDLQEFVDERRGDLPTKTVHITPEEIPYYHLKEPIQQILDSDDYKNNISDPDRIECKQAMHPIINFSKFAWLDQAVKINPFDSELYFWLDAGGSRFFNNFDLTEDYPGDAAYETLVEMGESFLVQMNCDYYPDLFNADVLTEEYLYDNRSYVLGSMFGGHKSCINNILTLVDDVLLNKMIANDNVNNEQIALGYLVKNHPDDFAVYSRTNGQHMDIFTELIE